MKSNDAELASQGRRLAGAVLDGFLFVLTLGIGWVPLDFGRVDV